MPPIRFELLRSDGAPVVYFPASLPLYRRLWCQVEVMALYLQDGPLTRIRVKGADEEMLLQTGVATALASIQACEFSACPLKSRLTAPVESLQGFNGVRLFSV
ncbi:hypothetical protein LMG27198_44690 [Methylocystis echinoides]|uniref:Uncharacterized protein n=2 Tax=Methylocystis echinoides TaxID=29468 RepID=A0A9W6GYT2_9HYPH|nr:hypothetical protein LMG27198_44690 [Methylocystis echinoides]